MTDVSSKHVWKIKESRIIFKDFDIIAVVSIPKYFSRKIIYHTLTFSVYNPLTHKEEHICLEKLLSYGMLSLWMLLLTNMLGFFLVVVVVIVLYLKKLK